MNSVKKKGKSDPKVIFMYHGDYRTNIAPNYSITFGFLDRYFKNNYKVVRHSLYDGGETRVYTGEEEENYKSIPIGRVPIPFRYFLETIFNLVYLLIEKPDVVISLDPLCSFAPCFLRRINVLKNVFFVTTDFAIKRFENPILNKAYFMLDKYCTKHCSKNVCNSSYVIEYKKNIYKKLKLKDKFFHLPNIPNPWEIDRYANTKKVPGRIIYVGAISNQMEFVEIINIIHKLKNVDKDVHMVLVGGGDKESEIRKYAEQKGIINIMFLGVLQHDKVLMEIAKSEFGIALYTGLLNYDEFRDSSKIREYQALGCIPIVSPIVKGNYREITDFDSGLVVQNLEDFGEQMEMVLSDQERKVKLTENALRNYRLYKDRYSQFNNLIRGNSK